MLKHKAALTLALQGTTATTTIAFHDKVVATHQADGEGHTITAEGRDAVHDVQPNGARKSLSSLQLWSQTATIRWHEKNGTKEPGTGSYHHLSFQMVE